MESQNQRDNYRGQRGYQGYRGRGRGRGYNRDQDKQNYAKTQPIVQSTPQPVKKTSTGIMSEEFAKAGGFLGWGSIQIGSEKIPEKPVEVQAQTIEKAKDEQSQEQKVEAIFQPQSEIHQVQPQTEMSEETILNLSQANEQKQVVQAEQNAEADKKEEVKIDNTTQDVIKLESNSTSQENSQTSDAKELNAVKAEEEKKEVKIIQRPFDPTQDAKDWDCIDLGSILSKKNKKKGAVSKKVIIKSQVHGQIRIKNDILLKLTKEIDFSMTKFEKPNKGFTNIQKVNCFMNVCLQSLLACPAFFNLLQAIVDTEQFQQKLSQDGLLLKLVKVARFFEGKNQLDSSNQYAKRVISAEQIFEPFLKLYNPESEQQDACDFLNCLLDNLHEELKNFYVPQYSKTASIQNLKSGGDWNQISKLKTTSVQHNQEQIFSSSLIRDIFGGVLRTEFHIQGAKNVSETHEPFFVLNLEIPKHAKTLQDCLESYFTDKPIHDYQQNGRNVRAWHKQLIDKLPNVLCICFKRFIYTDRLIKMKDYIKFDEVLKITDQFVSQQLRVGIFNTQVTTKSQEREVRIQPTEYRLFSVIEHIGEFANRGHYLAYSLDSEDHWKCFDDQRVSERDIEGILDDSQAYILFYEFIQ